jgi:hypothetical protein
MPTLGVHSAGKTADGEHVTSPSALEHEARWDPNLVLRVVWIRTLSAISLGMAVALLPMLGDDRMWIAALLVGPVPLGSWLVRRFVEPDRVLAVATVVDMVWCVVVPILLPTTYTAAMLVAVAMVAFVAGEDTRSLFYSATIGTVGFTAVGITKSIDNWIVLVTVYVLLFPLLFFFCSSCPRPSANATCATSCASVIGWSTTC